MAQDQHAAFSKHSESPDDYQAEIKNYLYFCSWLCLFSTRSLRFAHSTLSRNWLPRFLFVLYEAETKHVQEQALIRDATAACCAISWAPYENRDEIQNALEG